MKKRIKKTRDLSNKNQDVAENKDGLRFLTEDEWRKKNYSPLRYKIDLWERYFRVGFLYFTFFVVVIFGLWFFGNRVIYQIVTCRKQQTEINVIK